MLYDDQGPIHYSEIKGHYPYCFKYARTAHRPSDPVSVTEERYVYIDSSATMQRLLNKWREAAESHRIVSGISYTYTGLDFSVAVSKTETSPWRPMSECPENVALLFLWSNGDIRSGTFSFDRIHCHEECRKCWEFSSFEGADEMPIKWMYIPAS